MENIDSFYTLMGEASSLTKEAKYDEALIAYDNILDKYLDTAMNIEKIKPMIAPIKA